MPSFARTESRRGSYLKVCSNAERSEAWITADVAVTPTVVPIMELKYELEVAIALSASLIPVVNDMKATDRTSPFPKPL